MRNYTEQEKHVIQAIEYMKNHLNEDITTEILAHHVGYSPYHFIRLFKKTTGISPRHFLAALRIEASKQKLFDTNHSILSALLHVGYRSVGTFSTKFKQFVGVTPKEFQNKVDKTTQIIKNYDESKQLTQIKRPFITCHIQAPDHFRGIIFIGLFPRPIPDQKPIIGTALKSNRVCTFSNVPKGKYYLMMTSVKWSLNPKDYLFLDQSLRGMVKEPIIINKDSQHHFHVQLQEPSPLDPPILINLPNLLLDEKRAIKKN